MGGPTKRLQPWLDLAEDLRNGRANSVKRLDERPFTADGYCRGECGLGVHVWVRPVGNDGKSRYFFAASALSGGRLREAIFPAGSLLGVQSR